MNQFTLKNLKLAENEKVELFGIHEQNIKMIEINYDVSILARGDEITINNCDEIKGLQIQELFIAILKVIRSGYPINQSDVMQIITLANHHQLSSFEKLHECLVGKTFDGKKIFPKTIGQLTYVNALENHDIVFGIGPAGTGKTYLAVVHAIWLLKNRKVQKIILTRPAVEAGENLGFLPGDLKEKIDPYLKPLYDALDEMLGKETCQKYIDKGIIEIAPLAYMRGRTLENAYIILDEAQNTTLVQMKMFLTRLGFNSKMAITGDVTQIDLKNNIKSGLEAVRTILKNINEIKIVELKSSDVVRHPLVQKIIDAYENQIN